MEYNEKVTQGIRELSSEVGRQVPDVSLSVLPVVGIASAARVELSGAAMMVVSGRRVPIYETRLADGGKFKTRDASKAAAQLVRMFRLAQVA